MLDRLSLVMRRCTDAFEDYDHARALEGAEQFFWQFCDDYLELVKPRAYAADVHPGAAASAIAALRCGLSVLLRLLAPVLPFVTEEAWSWWQDGSIHRAPWPAVSETRALAAPSSPGAIVQAAQPAHGAGLDAAAAAIAAIRKAKSKARLPQRASVALLTATGPQAQLNHLSAVLADVIAAGHVAGVQLHAVNAAEMLYEVML